MLSTESLKDYICTHDRNHMAIHNALYHKINVLSIIRQDVVHVGPQSTYHYSIPKYLDELS